METVYSNTPTGASEEMVTEIHPGDEHPFPIPRGLMERVRGLTKLLRPVGLVPFECKTFPKKIDHEPVFLNQWEDCQMRLADFCAAMDEVCGEMEGKAGALMRGLILGLEREILREESLFEWVRATLEYDPAIRVVNELGAADPEEVTERPDKVVHLPN